MFSEKQLNFIEPFLEKIKLTEEEKTLIHQSYEAVAKQKAAEKEQQEAENQRLKERQQLLEKSQQSQKRFIRWIGVALVVMIVLLIWAVHQQLEANKSEAKARTNEKNADSARYQAQVTLAEFKKQQAESKALELKSFGDSYRDLGSIDNACDSYSKGLDTLAKYPDDPLYKELKKIKDSLKCN